MNKNEAYDEFTKIFIHIINTETQKNIIVIKVAGTLRNHWIKKI